jgi:hypothetical protein
MMMVKELFSTTLVEIVVEIFGLLWKSFPAISFTRFPQGAFSQSCGNVENSELTFIYKELNQ